MEQLPQFHETIYNNVETRNRLFKKKKKLSATQNVKKKNPITKLINNF